MRIFAISDLHVDFPDNFSWVSQLSRFDFQNDIILIAGDLTHHLDLLEKTLSQFRKQFKHVFYVPGNHDLWLKGDAYDNSLEKFWAIIQLCERCGVHTKPMTLGSRVPISIFPIFSWYTLPQEGESSLYWPKQGEDSKLTVWSDTHFITWPENFNACDYFLSLHDIKTFASSKMLGTTISFSHFLPRQELMYLFGKKTHTDRIAQFNFSSVAGSTQIDDVIRKIGSTVHIYGHHHRNQVQHIDGVTYISACLGYPYEQYCRNKWQLEQQGPLKIYERDGFVIP